MFWISWMTISGAIKSTQRMRVVSNKLISLHFMSSNRRVPFNLQSGQPLRQCKSIHEFVYMVEAGMLEMEAIQAATVNAADLLRISDKLGSVEVGKDTVRRVLATHYKPDPNNLGPSWLTILGQTKDSLWSVDLFRSESITLKTHWIMVVMDQYTRRIVSFAVHAGNVDGSTLCRMFNEATSNHGWPERISTDNDPLYRYRQWKANLRVLDIEEVKSLPHFPMSHPFVERLIGSIRRELLDQTFFWTAADLENKLMDYQAYYNQHRCHSSRDGDTPISSETDKVVDLAKYRWKDHCRGLFQLPIAA